MDTRKQKGYSRDVPGVDIAVPGIPKPLASYTPAARAGDLVFAAGHLASDFKQGVADEARLDPAFPYYGSAIKKQTRYVLENLARTFEAAGTSLSHVVKAQVSSPTSRTSTGSTRSGESSSRRRHRGRRSARPVFSFRAVSSRST